MRRTYILDRAWFTNGAPTPTTSSGVFDHLRRATTRLFAQLW